MSDLFLLDNSQIIDLYEIKLSDFEGYFYFHGSKNFKKDLIFKGVNYLYLPTEFSSLSYDSEGKQSRPVVKISNVNNFMTNLIESRKDLLGKDFHRKKILAKDLDDENFGGVNKNTLGVSNFKNFITEDKFIVNKKNYENKEAIEFELSNILDIDGLTCPSRKVYNNSCSWQYRGHGCNYGKISNYAGPYITTDRNSDFSLITDLSLLLADSDGNNQLGLSDNLISWYTFDQEGENYDVHSRLYSYSIWATGASAVTGVDLTKSVITKWKNVASKINSNTSILTGDFVMSDYAPLMPQTNIMNKKTGVCFKGRGFFAASGANQFVRAYIPKNFDNQDLTVIYVCRPTSWFNRGVSDAFLKGTVDEAPNGGIMSAGMVTGDKSTYLGFIGNRGGEYFHLTNPKDNSFQIKSSKNKKLGASSPYFHMDRPYIYSSVIPATHLGTGSFYLNGYTLFDMQMDYGGVGESHGISNLGFNHDDSVGSHLEIYEILIFNKLLNSLEVKSINNYLGEKYDIRTASSLFSGYDIIAGEKFFNDQDGNMGVPVADENDRLFFQESNNAKFKYYKNYGFKNLNYKGDYKKDYAYQRGDFVKIDTEINYDFSKDVLTQDSELPSRFFVCVSENGSKGFNPLDRTDIWIEDKCSKKISGCIARFRNDSSSERIPFGGFPGTVTYSYDLPQG